MSSCKGASAPRMQSCGAQINVFLQPGDWFFGGSNACVRTTLGSCVAFILWHSELRIGGICHYMLAHRAGCKAKQIDGRYADEALQLLDNAARARGARLRDFQVKLLGGADMFSMPKRAVTSVATCNIAAARALVQQYGLTVAAESLGGNFYRQILFSAGSGEVWLRCGPTTTPRPAPVVSAAGGAI